MGDHRLGDSCHSLPWAKHGTALGVKVLPAKKTSGAFGCAGIADGVAARSIHLAAAALPRYETGAGCPEPGRLAGGEPNEAEQRWQNPPDETAQRAR
jgi:hypothetical protein